jgi:hypothetical protein
VIACIAGFNNPVEIQLSPKFVDLSNPLEVPAKILLFSEARGSAHLSVNPVRVHKSPLFVERNTPD